MRTRHKMNEKEAWVAFSAFPLIGPARFALLRKYFGSARKAWKAPSRKYREIGFSQELVEKFEKFRREFDPTSYFLRMKKLGIEGLTLEDKSYPERLKKIEDAPYVLYVRKGIKSGKSAKSIKTMAEIAIAVVGTRKMTAYGREVTKRLVTGLVDAGVTIVSGLALGVDSVAHKTAIEAGGKTIGVLGGGLDQIYPPRNKQLAEAMLKSRGVLLSEYPLGYPSMPQNFPTRNRIVSGLSLGVLVIEGAEKSGTLLTASAAAVQGRDVFAVPGPITSPVSKAPHFLLRNGAKLVEGVGDILEELNISSKLKAQMSKQILPETKEEKRIMGILDREGLDIDTIIRESRLNTDKVMSALTNMELKGMVKNVGGVYIKIQN